MIVIDPGSALPPFQQIKDAVSTARDTGTFPAGHRLPPVRALAEELGVAVNTVARSYRELEAEGIIVTRGRKGSFVTGTSESLPRAVSAATRDYVTRMQELQADLDTVLAEVRAQW